MISEIVFHPDLAQERGLRGGRLERLGNIVILAGPNGAGKSRYLQLIQDVFVSRLSLPLLEQMATENKRGIVKDLDLLDSGPDRNRVDYHKPDREDSYKEEVLRFEAKLRRINLWLAASKSMVFAPAISSSHIPSLVRLVYPTEDVPTDNAREISPPFLTDQTTSTLKLSFGAFTGMGTNLNQIAHALWYGEHPEEKLDELKREQISNHQQHARAFNKILRILLDGEISFTVDGTEILPTFRNRPIVASELSPGERILIMWANSIQRMRESSSSTIVLIDEPENHLHHDACIRALTKLLDNEVLGPQGQVWLATHSVPLLAWGGLDSVHFVKDGAIEFAGNKVTSVVESLLGGKDGRDRLNTALSDADEIAFMEFAVQCVLPAGVADPKTGDRQQAQFIEMLRQRLSTQQEIRILDFSAGKGRFGSALREHFAAQRSNALQRQIEYHAYNAPQFTSSAVKEACKARIAALGQSGAVDNYYWESLSQLQAKHGQTINLIVLCNVLHEIRPENWLPVFNDINGLLAPDGCVVVMEDLFPPVGELPNERGYLLLDEFGLGLLFGDPKGVKLLEKRENRLMAVEIPKQLISQVTRDTRKAALTYLRDYAKEQVIRLRSQEKPTPSHRVGREHAHYSMLFTNACLALEAI
jgi:Fe-S cluster assembly ATPase SufC